MKKLKKIPEFKDENREDRFWSGHDSSEYLDWSKAKKIVYKNLKPSVKSISLRLPESMLDDLKQIANKNDIPYQSLMKIYLADKIKEESEKYRSGKK